MINEHKKGVKAIKYNAKPRNFVAKNAGSTTSGAGAHKDKKKAMKQGEIKHKAKELAESVPYDQKLNFLLKAAVIKDKIRESVTTEGAKVDRQAKHITASMMKKGKSRDEAEAIAWAHIKHPKKKKVKEENAEYDDEAGMARNSLKTMHRAIIGLAKTIDQGDNLPEWCQEKLSLAEDYLVTVWDYLQSEQGVAEGQLEFNTPDPVVVVQDLKGNILDKINLSVAVQKYKLGAAQNIKNQLAHQNYTTIGNYVIVSPMSGQPQDATTQGVAEAGYGRNRGYTQGFASPNAPSLGGNKYDSDGNQLGGGHDEYHVPDPVDNATWFIRINGKLLKDRDGSPYHYRNKEDAAKAARTMMAKPFNAGKKFTLTTSHSDA